MAYINCKHCGCQMSDKSEACPVCGASVVEDDSQKEDIVNTLDDNQQESTHADSKAKHKNNIPLIVTIFIAVVTITTIVFLNYKEKKAAEQLRIQHQVAAEQAKLKEQKREEEEKQKRAKELEFIRLEIEKQVLKAYNTCSITNLMTPGFKNVEKAMVAVLNDGFTPEGFSVEEFYSQLECASEAKVTNANYLNNGNVKVDVHLFEEYDDGIGARWETSFVMVRKESLWLIDDVVSGNFSYKNAMAKFVNEKYTNKSTQYVVIDGSGLRLRLGPSTNADTFKWPDGTNRHPKVGEKFTYLGESGDFYKIDFNGTALWVSKQYTHLVN